MSQELIRARKQLANVNTLLKQDKHMAAVKGMTDALVTVLKSPLMKSERDEFNEMVANAVYSLNSNAELRKHYPLIIKYKPGEEKDLLGTMHDLLKALQEVVTEEAQQDLADLERRKHDALEQGQKLLDAHQVDEAKEVFNQLVREYRTDTSLKADIADRYIKAELYEDAFHLLEEALEHDPNAIFLYNRIGIALRKMQDFEQAERYYIKALEINQKDEYLFFNLGRLYYDWKRWDKMAEAAGRALRINADFKEAAKMLQFAQKKMG